MMKSLAATILTQRSEVEQFFLESLHEVKEYIQKQRRKEKADEIAANTKARAEGKYVVSASGKAASIALGGASTLPQIKGVNPKYLQTRGPSTLPDKPDDHITIKDLRWEDKELVLRVLFAKMNGLQDMVDTAVVQSKNRAPNASGGNDNDLGRSKPVFISEGAYMPEEDEEAMMGYQEEFEMTGARAAADEQGGGHTQGVTWDDDLGFDED